MEVFSLAVESIYIIGFYVTIALTNSVHSCGGVSISTFCILNVLLSLPIFSNTVHIIEKILPEDNELTWKHYSDKIFAGIIANAVIILIGILDFSSYQKCTETTEDYTMLSLAILLLSMATLNVYYLIKVLIK